MTPSIRVALLASGLLANHAAAAADPPYSSRSSCVRAEAREQCDKWFPEPKSAAGTQEDSILLLDTCTGILGEASARLRMAITYLRFDNSDESMSLERQAWKLHTSATDCVRDANRATPTSQAEWKAAEIDYESQLTILTAAKRARP